MFGTDGLMVPGWKLEEILPELGRRSSDWIQQQAKAESRILSLLTGKADRLPDRPPVVHHDYKGNFAIHHGKWKLVGNKLFDMEADPKEQADLAAAHSETAQRLAAALEACQAGEGGTEIGD